MHDVRIYQIKLRGKVDEIAFEVTSPLQLKVEHADANATMLIVNADQSGLIGVLRYLHQQGFVLLSATRTEE